MSDIVLIQPPIRDFYLTRKRTYPYGLALIAAELEKNGFSVEILDALATRKTKKSNWPDEMSYLHPYYGKPDITPFSLFHQFTHFGYGFTSVAEKARRASPWIAGIASLFTPYHEYALETAAAVRKTCPGAIIVLGGHHPTAFPEAVLSSGAVDYIIRGDGEQAMAMLANRIKANAPLNDIPGLGWKTRNGGFHIHPPAYVKHLDDLPVSPVDFTGAGYYSRRKRKSIVVSASRGCPMRCSYCCMGGREPAYRIRSVDHVLREIESALSHDDVGFIDFEDEHLTLNKTWFMNLMAEMINRYGDRNIELRAMNGLYPPSLDNECIQVMRQAGFKTLNLSIGALDRPQLARFNRPDMTKPVTSAIDAARRENLDVVAYLIAGAPSQNARQTLNDILWLAEQDVLAGLSVFYPAPESHDFDVCKKLELLPGAMSLYRSTAIPLSSSTSRTETVTLLRIARIVNFMKSLKDRNVNFFEPIAPHHFPARHDAAGRRAIGIEALRRLFREGRIMGYSPDTGFYAHLASQPLLDLFVSRIKHRFP